MTLQSYARNLIVLLQQTTRTLDLTAVPVPTVTPTPDEKANDTVNLRAVKKIILRPAKAGRRVIKAPHRLTPVTSVS